MNYLITAVCIIIPVAIIFLLTRKKPVETTAPVETTEEKVYRKNQEYKAKYYRPKRYRKFPKI